MNLILIGTNHRHTDIKTRETLSFSQNDIMLALSSIVEEGIAGGVVILSTCQRIEIYAHNSNAALLKRFFIRFKELPDPYAEYFYIKEGQEVVHHLFKVASGLDSQVIGEVEILGQVRNAYLTAKGAKTTTPLLNRLFEYAIFASRSIRRLAVISEREPSIASIAVEECEKLAGLRNRTVFIVGSGVIAAKIAAAVVHKGVKCVVVANRTFEKAKELAAQVNGKAVRFEEFHRLLNDADIIFSTTASRHLILKKEVFLQNRTVKKKLVIFDLAFPRDIDPAIGGIENVSLLDLDNFKEENLFKSREILRANKLVLEKTKKFLEKEEERWKSGLAHDQALLR